MPRGLADLKGHSFGAGQEKPGVGVAVQGRGCESFSVSQGCRQRREENCSHKMASGWAWENVLGGGGVRPT